MKTLMHSVSLLLLLHLLHLTGGADTGDAWPLAAEHAVLMAVRRAFDNPVLNASWIGYQCFDLNRSSWVGIRCINNRVTSISLDGFGLSVRFDDLLALASLTELTRISFKNNSIYGNMIDFSTNVKISSIDLSMNTFTGPISNSLLGLDHLESLQLYRNKFDGPIPPFNQASLKAFNVSYNNLTGEIPKTAALQSFGTSSYVGNPGLCAVSCQAAEAMDPKKLKHNIFTQSTFMFIFVVLNVIVLIILLWSIFAFCKKKRALAKEKGCDHDQEDDNGDKECGEKSEVVMEEQRKITFVNGGDGVGFTLDQLLKASAEGLGKGSFGSCYKAKLERAIVVKRLRDLKPLTSEEFTKHMTILGGIKHPNLLPLLGYYFANNEKLLFYNFASKGNLYDRIHGGGRGKDRIPFKWHSRLTVAQGVAQAMEFLHLNTKGQAALPHGNLKSSNVLLDGDEVALVCDYGLTPLTPVPLMAQRMMSYRSPEYEHARSVSRKSDVWSYGCLLLELITGRISKHADQRGIEGVDLCTWVHRAVREEWTCEVFDAEISRQRGDTRGVFKLLQLALRCCERFPERRPEMGEVVREVEGIKPSEREYDDEEEDEEAEDSLDRSFVPR